jgi:hypothetical protein
MSLHTRPSAGTSESDWAREDFNAADGRVRLGSLGVSLSLADVCASVDAG